MINIIFPIFDKIDYWISLLLPFVIQNLFWGIIAGTFAFIIYWLLSDQDCISNIKNDMKDLRKKMFDSSLEDKAEYNSLAKKNLSLSFKLLGKILLPATLSILPVVIIAIWYDMNHSFIIPFEQDKVAVSSLPIAIDFNVEPYEISSNDIDGNTFIYPVHPLDKISFFNKNGLIYSDAPFSKPIPYITKRKWWNLILGSPIGYLYDEANIEVLIFDYPEKVVFNKIPKIINGWELLFFLGIFITALPLRIIFKVK